MELLTLRMAAIGYRARLAEVEAQIAQQERGRKPRSAATRRHVLSPAARRRIAAAQRKRWAAYRRQKKAA